MLEVFIVILNQSIASMPGFEPRKVNNKVPDNRKFMRKSRTLIPIFLICDPPVPPPPVIGYQIKAMPFFYSNPFIWNRSAVYRLRYGPC